MNINPFKPSSGEYPAHFAGREQEEYEIRNSIDVLTGKKGENNKLIEIGPDTPYMLMGPRGVGKTTLMARIGDYAELHGVKTFTLSSKDFNNGFGKLIKSLSTNYLKVINKLLKINFAFQISDLAKINISPAQSEEILEIVLETKLKKNPILLICDEAHEYNKTEFGYFSNIILEFMSKNYPLGVILAGTPGLIKVINKINASFMGRVKLFYLNRLSDAASISAIEEPFNKYNLKFENGILKKFIDKADNYPYFLQIIGRELWDIIHKNNINLVNMDVFNKVISNSSAARNSFYQQRRSEILSIEHDEAIFAVIAHMRRNNDRVDMRDLHKFVKDKFNGVDYKGILDQMVHWGIIWEDESVKMVPGIPSFFDFIMNLEEERNNSKI